MLYIHSLASINSLKTNCFGIHLVSGPGTGSDCFAETVAAAVVAVVRVETVSQTAVVEVVVARQTVRQTAAATAAAVAEGIRPPFDLQTDQPAVQMPLRLVQTVVVAEPEPVEAVSMRHSEPHFQTTEPVHPLHWASYYSVQYSHRLSYSQPPFEPASLVPVYYPTETSLSLQCFGPGVLGQMDF